MDADDDDVAMYVVTLGDAVYIFVNSMLSPTEMKNWSMTARFDVSGALVYEDCSCMIGSVDANGVYSERTVSENGSGWFSFERGDDALLADAVLRWDGAEDEDCRSFVFERVPDDE